MKKYCVYVMAILLCRCMAVNAQDMMIFPAMSPGTQTQGYASTTTQDTVPKQLSETDLNKITDIRSQFEKQNSYYSRPAVPSSNLLRFLQKDKLEMSEEFMNLLKQASDASTMIDDHLTLQDTTIVNPLFLPLIFRGNILPDQMPFDKYLQVSPIPTYTEPIPVDSIFKKEQAQLAFEQSMFAYMRYNYPEYYRYSEREMPQDMIESAEIKKDLFDNLPVLIESTEATGFDDVEAPPKFIPERQYWQSGFESVIQFSQNYISPNWYKGGTGNLNLFTRNYIRYDYKKDKIQLTNEMELKISVYTAPKDTLRDYKMGDDLLRFHSNFGYQAFNKWYYTLDGELKTQLFKNYKENTNDLQTALFSPFSINLGLGMKYDLDKKFKDKHKNLKLSTNLAPISYTFMYNYNDKVNLERFGFKKKPDSNMYENTLSQFGSTIRANLAINFNRNVSWESRLYYFTNYHRVEAEFENTLRLAISRFFSTRIYIHLRYDDGVAKNADFDSYFQVNELLSFGFNYKW